MRVRDVGEFGLIERLARLVGVEHPHVVVGIGDDVAVLDVGGPDWLLATVDCQIEGVHFLRHAIPPDKLGRRALAVNLSDIASMGGRPDFALVSLALPDEIEAEWVEDLYRGIRQEGDLAGVAVVGGNISRSPNGVFVDITVLGRVNRDRVLRRSGARPGDVVLVTGTLGDAAAGLHLLLHPEVEVDASLRETLLDRLFTPTPRLKEADTIARLGGATAMIDISDGLSSDVGHICEAGGVGVRLWADRLPLSEGARQVAELKGVPAWELALTGGEDYELCLTARPEAVEKLIEAVAAGTGTPLTPVGQVEPLETGRRLVLPDGREVALEARGWRHF